jgi:outer membrane protein assembly factor BamB
LPKCHWPTYPSAIFGCAGSISVAPAVAAGRVFAGQQGGERFFYCVDAEAGVPVWKQTIPGGWVWGLATVAYARSRHA